MVAANFVKTPVSLHLEITGVKFGVEYALTDLAPKWTDEQKRDFAKRKSADMGEIVQHAAEWALLERMGLKPGENQPDSVMAELEAIL